MNTYQAHPVHTLQEMSRLKTSFPDNIKLYVAREESGKMLAEPFCTSAEKWFTRSIFPHQKREKKAHAPRCFVSESH